MIADVYTRDGELVEIHYITENKKELYILLDQKEPRVFITGEKELELVLYDDDPKILQEIIKEGEKKFRKIRLEQLFHEKEIENPPVLTFFENIITEKDIETIKQGLKKHFLNRETHVLRLAMFLGEQYPFEYWFEMIRSDENDYLEITFSTPFYDTFVSNRRRKKFNKKMDVIGKICFTLEKIDAGLESGKIKIKDIF